MSNLRRRIQYWVFLAVNYGGRAGAPWLCCFITAIYMLAGTEIWLLYGAVTWEASLALLYHVTAVCLPCFIMIYNGLLSHSASLFKIASLFKNKASRPSTLNLKVWPKRLHCRPPAPPLPHLWSSSSYLQRRCCAEQQPHATQK